MTPGTVTADMSADGSAILVHMLHATTSMPRATG